MSNVFLLENIFLILSEHRQTMFRALEMTNFQFNQKAVILFDVLICKIWKDKKIINKYRDRGRGRCNEKYTLKLHNFWNSFR